MKVHNRNFGIKKNLINNIYILFLSFAILGMFVYAYLYNFAFEIPYFDNMITKKEMLSDLSIRKNIDYTLLNYLIIVKIYTTFIFITLIYLLGKRFFIYGFLFCNGFYFGFMLSGLVKVCSLKFYFIFIIDFILIFFVNIFLILSLVNLLPVFRIYSSGVKCYENVNKLNNVLKSFVIFFLLVFAVCLEYFFYKFL